METRRLSAAAAKGRTRSLVPLFSFRTVLGKNGPKIESLLGSRTSPLLRQVDKPVAVLPFLTSIYAGRSTGRR